ncbi:MAG: T9SS type A sorting domain-containing protein [Lewinellaceae bacterium]|nr:T9SS type A sorting domain-containing protein [Phaeodactylibacter sp.]MCB9041034.1 T9SS type A sorting domain-containing protein [Lewinellaceae bacterium]
MLHPNPATEYLNVFLKDGQISRRKTPQLRILSMEGKVLETYRLDPIDEVTHMIAVRQLPAGVYVLQYYTGEGILVSEKFSKVE